MIYCKELSFCYVAVPKTGTTSIERFLVDFCNSKDVTFIKANKSNTQLHNIEGKHASISAIKTTYSTENVITAGFVRNPWDKVVSWFNYLKVNKRSVHTIDPKMSFEEFVHSAPSWVFNQSSQYLTDNKGNVDVDFVGRFEELDVYFKLMCDLFGVNGGRIKRLNSTHSNIHYSELYTPDTAKFVEERFADDIELFNYTFEKTS